MSNRLSSALSPYLLQHADNPVDWHEWGEEAFVKAREEDKPVFLSIGYATCHWCHVMAHESFEDDEVAALLNEHCIPIKVDREERPDVDALYMAVCQATTGHGGWPLTVFLTPDQRPFYVGTYFPKRGRANRPGMLELVPAVARAWTEGRDQVLKSANDLVDAVREGLASRPQQDGDALNERVLQMAYNGLAGRFDEEHGGFEKAPKFPTPHNLLFLLREHAHTGDERALRMVTRTLVRMRLGGIWDHVGFGFHRYSTDRFWKLPHFEKMLYDQALLALAYTEAWHTSRQPLLRQTAEEVFAYVHRDLTSPAGAFYSAEDADSRTASGEMEEGAFYVWTWDEIAQALEKDDVPLALALFNAERGGNFRDEATQELTGANVLYRSNPPADAAAFLSLSEDELARRVDRILQTLREARASRERPLLDDKVLADWNGLMIAALARAAWVFDEPEYAERASRAARFILDEMSADDGGLHHRYREGQAGLTAFSDDYAFMMWGLLELHQATFEPVWLSECARLAEYLLARFRDEENGGLFIASNHGEQLLVRQKEYYDGATPSANSVAAFVLIRLAHLTGRMEFEGAAESILRSSVDIVRMPSAHTMAASAVRQILDPPREVVIAAEDPADREALLAVLRERYRPDLVVHVRGADAEELGRVAPFVRQQGMVEGEATVYVCERFACRQPVNTPDDLRAELDAEGGD